MTPIGWRAWYATGNPIDSTQMAWDLLPASGLQVVMVYFDEFAAPGVPYRRIMHGTDRYFMTRDDRRAGDGTTFGQTDDALKATQDARTPESIKVGTQIADRTYQALLDRAMHDFGIPGLISNPVPVTEPPKGLIGTMLEAVFG